MSQHQMDEMASRHIELKEHCTDYKLIRVYMPLLERDLIPSFIIPNLQNFLSKDEIQRVIKAEEDSIENGARKLLELLLTRKEPRLFNAFVKALRDNGYEIIAQQLTDEVEVKDAEQFTELISKFYDRLSEVNGEDLLPLLLEKGTISKKDVTDIKTKEENDGRLSALFMLLLRLPQHKHSWLLDLIDALRQNDSTSYQDLASAIESAINQGGSPTTEQSTSSKNTMADKENPDIPVTSETLNNLSASSTQKSLVKTITNSFDQNHADQGDASKANTYVKQKNAAENCHHSADRNNDEIKLLPLELRSYQKELARQALDDRNVIIMAPTGSGKTHVALYITQNHLFKSSGGKVLFLVPTTELVSQQTQMFQTYLGKYKVHGLTGQIQESQKVPLSSVIDNHHIIVMTPQIMLNALRLKDVQSLRVFTLMIFDECHHTTKEHPYNNIMATYLDEKYNKDRDYLLPQVIGLTASVGVGNANTLSKAVDHILSLCANLDTTDGISTVEENKQELNAFVNKPKEKKIETQGRLEDPFKNIINYMMRCIEDKMKELTANSDTLKELKEIPSGKGCDQYTQWISRLEKAVVKYRDQGTRTALHACHEHLKNYNTALVINEDCRTVDALAYLKKEMSKLTNVNGKHKQSIDNWLENLYNKSQNQLESISHNQKYYNPKLRMLAELLLDKYREKQDMRAIIFCKTREMTMAIQKWIEETEELKMLRPYHLVGARACAERGGMTQNKQEDVLNLFRDGLYNVIIATSVAEEGLDVSKCSLVIRYEHVTNEISMIQARGRGRDKDSHYIVMGDRSRGAPMKETLNKIREELMNEAIKAVKEMPDEERVHIINTFQEKARMERRMNEAGKQARSTGSCEFPLDEIELRCLKCDQLGCLMSDVRIFENSHHMVLDEDFTARTVIERHPNPRKIDDVMMTDRICCKKCYKNWGLGAIYKSVKVYVIKIASFAVVNVRTNHREAYSKWKKVPLTVKELTPEDLQEYCRNMPEIDD